MSLREEIENLLKDETIYTINSVPFPLWTTKEILKIFEKRIDELWWQSEDTSQQDAYKKVKEMLK